MMNWWLSIISQLTNEQHAYMQVGPRSCDVTFGSKQYFIGSTTIVAFSANTFSLVCLFAMHISLHMEFPCVHHYLTLHEQMYAHSLLSNLNPLIVSVVQKLTLHITCKYHGAVSSKTACPLPQSVCLSTYLGLILALFLWLYKADTDLQILIYSTRL